MIFSAFVYLSLLGLMILTGRPYYKIPLKKGNHNIPFYYCFVPSLLFAFVFGIRYGVGTDHLNYIDSYLYGSIREVEIGYTFLESQFKKNGLHFAWLFGFIAFIQITFYISAFKDRNIYPWLILVMILSCRWLGWCNGIRQSIAVCLFVYSIQFIEEKKPFLYLPLILLATLFHRSAIILLPFYFIGKIDLFRFKLVPWIVYFIAYYMQQQYIDMDSSFINRNFDVVASFLGYEDVYSVDTSLEKITFKEGESSGLGVILNNANNFLILALMQPAKRFYNSNWFTILSNLFLIGLFGVTAFSGIVVLLRPFGYFSLFKGIIMAYLLQYLFFKKNRFSLLCGWLLIIFLLLSFIAVIYRGDINTAEYHVFWEFV